MKIHLLLQGLRVKTCNVDSKVDLVHSNFLLLIVSIYLLFIFKITFFLIGIHRARRTNSYDFETATTTDGCQSNKYFARKTRFP